MRILTDLAAEHDPGLVLLAAAICSLGAWVSVRLFRHVRGTVGWSRAGRVFLGAVAIGAAVWCTHFVAMLAYRPGVAVSYGPGLTALSLLVAILGCGAGLALAASGGRRAAYAGGAVLGAGIAGMHYTGMAAFTADAVLVWDGRYVAASVASAVLFCALALRMAARTDRPHAQWSAAALLVVAIVSLHFTGMAALVVLPFVSSAGATTSDAAREAFAVVIAGAGLLVLGAGAASQLVDRQAHAAAASRLRHLTESSTDGIVVEQDGRIVEVNAAFEGLAGAPRAALLGSTFATWLARPDGIGERSVARSSLRTADGAAIPVEVAASRERGRQGEPTLMVYAVRDLRPQLAQERAIAQLARNDGLTGLPNRASFHDALELAVATRKDTERIALLAIDLDRFKEVNDLHGHAAGDRVLRALSHRAGAVLRKGELLARLGGDEFVALARVDGREAALDLAHRLADAFGDAVAVGREEVVCGASIGIALLPDDAVSTTALISNADLAMRRAQASLTERICCYEQAMDEAVRARRRIATDLRDALAREEFDLHYQPQASIATGEVTGYEVLLRWTHPEHGAISPADFIPLAEEAGLIVPIGAWVLRAACTVAASWPVPHRIAVNLSPVQLASPDLPALVQRTLDETGLAPGRLELEITETAMMRDPAHAAEVLGRIKALGVSIAMDDFGTGYSSLSMLRAFPFDKIKLDRSFMGEMDSSAGARAIIRSVVTLAANLGIPVLAEGVETDEQLTFLRALACDEGQGYLFGRPAPSIASRAPNRTGPGRERLPSRVTA